MTKSEPPGRRHAAGCREEGGGIGDVLEDVDGEGDVELVGIVRRR